MATSKKTKTDNERMLEELDAIKRLLAYTLLHISKSQEHVARALNVNQSSVSRMFPAEKRGRKGR